ncbi:TonB-dependent receptor [Terriglobus albidus]|uniref:TonB-dependent receptor n=1 Tax=Terriglobus albidus TaxID=1592106 RepID=A0A5B9ECW1_9BACT|nr:TonB-dependent receptor [Terriglobus albidus]QEE28995.1 TonB-dependent receptor [Terriglobus albidus]
MIWLRLTSALALALLLLSDASLRAQSGISAALSGVVTDTTGAALPGAKLTLTFVRSGAERKQLAGPDGGFAFIQLTTGDYRLGVEAVGFGSAQQAVSYQGAPIHLMVPLGAAASTEVTVSATDIVEEPTAPAHVLITPEEIDRMPSQSVSAPFSSLITMTTPGVSADSNGSFHPLGDHAEASFFVDGQPITDQQSRTFSTQVSLNTLQSVDVREGAPGADVGDKTSMIIAAQTRSGLDQRRPSGTLQFGRGSFSTTNAGASLGFGTERFGSFTAADAVNSARFLDTPEAVNLHANGNAENAFQRFDYRLTDKTILQLSTSLSHSWFQTPNTFDQQTLRQNQRQTIVSFNAAPQLIHTFNDHAFHRINFWVRQDKVRYRPSGDIFSDSPAYLAQARRLTNAGTRTEFTYTHGRHNLVAGGEYKHTFLTEQFATGLTDATYNSPCLGPDGAPSSNTTVRDPSLCASAGLTANADYLPGLLPLDLTRGGSVYSFRGRTDIKQLALFGQDFIRMGQLQLKLGLRYDKYNGMVSTNGVQPRLGMTYGVLRIRTTFRGDYSRVFLTPYNENLIVASSDGPGSPSASLRASGSHVLSTATRNQFNIGFTTDLKRVSFSAEYLWKFTYGAYDFDVLLNSPLTFPTQFAKSKIDGGLVRVSLHPYRGFAGFVTVSHTRSRLFGPQLGGVSFSAPYSNVVRPDHDEGLAMNLNARYQFGRRGPWINASYRYDGGLVSVATPDIPTVLKLSGDEQQQMGLHCGDVFATVSMPIRSCDGATRATRIRIPAPGTYDADRNPSRVAVRNTVDLSIGKDDLISHEKQSLGIRLDIVNLNNTSALYNYLSTFSGTHFLTPRATTVALRYTF